MRQQDEDTISLVTLVPDSAAGTSAALGQRPRAVKVTHFAEHRETFPNHTQEHRTGPDYSVMRAGQYTRIYPNSLSSFILQASKRSVIIGHQISHHSINKSPSFLK